MSTKTHNSSLDNKNQQLEERVKSMRIGNLEGRASRSSQSFAWGLTLIFMITAAVMTWRSYSVAPPGGWAVINSQGNSPSQAVMETPKGQPNPSALGAKESQPRGKEGIALEAKGYIIPVHQIQVSPKVPGMIEKLFFEEGKRVKKGDILAILESVDYKADVDKARGAVVVATQRLNELKNGNRPEEIEQAKQEYSECQSQLEQMRLDLQRNRRLTGAASLSQRELDVAQYNYEAMARRSFRLKSAFDLAVKGPREERIRAAEAELTQATAELTKADWRWSNCVVTAPVSGIILTKKAEEGNIVNPMAFNVSATLCDMADLTDLEIDLTIQERDIALVHKGQKCLVMPEAFMNHGPFLKLYPRGYEGEVSRLMPIADRAKGAIPVRVKIRVTAEEEGVYLKPDMGVIVSFQR
ncbi:MAG: biotin/lipoyl-binding protein [Gemmataceae bacterium]|nr:biotin/lipoyl-binding protein [Gemmataceae bacterium]